MQHLAIMPYYQSPQSHDTLHFSLPCNSTIRVHFFASFIIAKKQIAPNTKRLVKNTINEYKLLSTEQPMQTLMPNINKNTEMITFILLKLQCLIKIEWRFLKNKFLRTNNKICDANTLAKPIILSANDTQSPLLTEDFALFANVKTKMFIVTPKSTSEMKMLTTSPKTFVEKAFTCAKIDAKTIGNK